ncbi:MAG: hypothetical protein Q9187_006035 [Circinaria calcarea]
MPFLYTIIEPAFAIVCACLPTYRPLFVWISALIPYHYVCSNVVSWFSRPKRREPGSTSSTPLFARVTSPTTPNTCNAYSPDFNTSEKWPRISSPEISNPHYIHGSLFLFDPPPVQPRGDLPTWIEFPPRARRCDDAWAKDTVTRACDSSAFHGQDDDSLMIEVSPRNVHDSVAFV